MTWTSPPTTFFAANSALSAHYDDRFHRGERFRVIARPMMLCQNRLSGSYERRGCDLRVLREDKGVSGAGRGVHGRVRLPERGELPRAARGVREPVVRAPGH